MKLSLMLAFLFMTLLLRPLAGQTADIMFSSAIKKSIRQNLERDLNALSELPLDKADPATLKLLGINELSASALEDWLNERVKAIIDEKAFSFLSLPINKSISVERSEVDYPFAATIPFSLQNHLSESEENENSDESDEGIVVMSNIGTGIYLNGKQEKKIYAMKISRGFLKSDKIVIDSPRAGIIQIGPGLFARKFTINNNEPESIANSIHRLGNLFHEARHSDGHGESLGFVHARCPKGHDLEGAYACDENLNGPYTVSARVVSELIKACDDICSVREQEILKLTVLDSQNRVLDKTFKGVKVKNWDDRPEFIK